LEKEKILFYRYTSIFLGIFKKFKDFDKLGGIFSILGNYFLYNLRNLLDIPNIKKFIKMIKKYFEEIILLEGRKEFV